MPLIEVPTLQKGLYLAIGDLLKGRTFPPVRVIKFHYPLSLLA